MEEKGEGDAEFWESLKEKPPTAKSWKTSVDVQQDGFSDTHATGNQQRHGAKSKTTVTVVQQEMSPTRGSFRFSEKEVLSVEPDSVDFDPILETNAVPDTACRRTLIGEYTLSRLERHLMKQGYKVKKVPGEFSFRFGNSGTLVSREIAVLPACLGGKHFALKASILPKEGKCTPLLLSKEFLRDMKVRLDLGSDCAWFGRLGVEVHLGETERGHYAIPMFDFGVGSKDCLVVGCDGKKNRKSEERSFDISNLERLEKESLEDRLVKCSTSSHGSLLRWRGLDRQSSTRLLVQRSRDLHGEPNDDKRPAGSETDASSNGRESIGRLSRFARRWNDVTSARQHCAQGRQVCKEQAVLDGGTHLLAGQELCALGPSPYQSGQLPGDAETEDLHLSPGQQEEDSHGRGQVQDGSADAILTSHDEHGTTMHSGDQTAYEDEGTQERSQVHEGTWSADGIGRDGCGSVVPDLRHGVSAEARESHAGLGSDGGTDEQQPEHSPEGDGPASHQDEPRDALEVRDEHDLHVEHGVKAAYGLQTVWKERNVEAWPEKEKCCGVMSKRVRKELMRNMHDIDTCDHDREEHMREDSHDIFHIQLDHGQVHVGEAFSNPRVVPQANKMGFRGGKSYDLGTGWNFLRSDHRKQCREEIKEHKPRVLIISPPCGPFSQMLRISKHRCDQRERERGKELKALCC